MTLCVLIEQKEYIKMKKIMFLYHVKEREHEIICIIAQQIRRNCSNVEIRSGEFYNSILETIQFRPDVIVSIPPRDCYSSNYLTMLKIITGAVVISMNTEGYYVFSPREISVVIGYNTYAKELVDYYIVWGQKTKKILGEALLKADKLTNIERVKATGYVWYEKDIVSDRYKKYSIYSEMKKWSEKYKNNILVLTGFLVAENSINDYQILGYFGDDKPLNKRTPLEIAQAKESIATEREFRTKYIDMIIYLANNNPDVGITVKMHPLEIEEKNKCYDILAEYPNIFLVKEAVPVGIMLNFANSMIHYNSTCNLEAYIYNVPTVQIYDDSKKTSYEFVWQLKGDSTYYININEFQKLDEIFNPGVKFRRAKTMERELFDLYNWQADRPYKAIEKNAYYIARAKTCQRLKFQDNEVIQALNSEQGRGVINLLIRDTLINMSCIKKVFKNIYALYRIYKYILFGRLPFRYIFRK